MKFLLVCNVLFHAVILAERDPDDSEFMYYDGEECGLITDGKIVEGVEANLHQFPWLVAFVHPTKRTPVCAGVLIKQRFVLTAGHCEPVANIVRLGEHNFLSNPDQQQGYNGVLVADPYKEIKVINKVKRVAQTKEDKDLDFLLLELEEDVKPTEFIKPICLPTDDIRYGSMINRRVIAAGWGYFSGLPEPSFTKRWTSLTVTNETDEYLITEGKSGRDTCTGDSGGPLMVIDSKTSRYHLAGIVKSGDSRCGYNKGNPTTNINVAKQLGWLEDEMSYLLEKIPIS